MHGKCDPSTGLCLSCDEGFKGDLCDVPVQARNNVNWKPKKPSEISNSSTSSAVESKQFTSKMHPKIVRDRESHMGPGVQISQDSHVSAFSPVKNEEESESFFMELLEFIAVLIEDFFEIVLIALIMAGIVIAGIFITKN